MLRLEARAVMPVRRFERDLGEVAHRADDLRERSEAGEIARGDAQEHARAQLAQRARERGIRGEVVSSQEFAHRGGGPARVGGLLDLRRERGTRREQARGVARAGEDRGPVVGARHKLLTPQGKVRRRGRVKYNPCRRCVRCAR